MATKQATAASRKPAESFAQAIAATPIASAEPAPIPSKTLKIMENLTPWLDTSSTILSGLDANDIGPDDFAAYLLDYASQVLTSVLTGDDIPALPDALAAGVTGKLSDGLRYSLMGASAGVALLQMQLAFSHPKAAIALKYINQSIKALVAGRPVATIA
jgi:hypothetical protein